MDLASRSLPARYSSGLRSKRAAAPSGGLFQGADLVVVLVFVGLCLSPFSTSRDSVFHVFPFGVPLFALAASIVALKLVSHQHKASLGLFIGVLLSTAFVVTSVVMSFESPQLIPSLWRLFPALTGLFVYFFMAVRRPLHAARKSFDLVSVGVTLSGVVLAVYYMGNFAFASAQYGFVAVLASREVLGLAELPWGASNLVGGILLFPLVHSVACAYALRASGDGSAVRLRAAAIVFIMAGIATTLSRTSGAIALSFVLVHFLVQRRSIVSAIRLAAAALIVSGIGYWLYVQILTVDVADIFAGRANNLNSFNSRSEIWSEMIADSFGVTGRPLGYYSLIDTYGYTGHSWTVSTIAEQGILGLAVGAAFLFWITLWSTGGGGRDAGAQYRAVIRLGAGFIFVAMHFEDIVYASQYYQYFWTLMGLAALSRHAFNATSPQV